MSSESKERWGNAEAYERYMGRWSRMVAQEFLAWLAVPPHKTWIDVGCGTGGVVASILAHCAPQTVMGIDRAEGFLADARRHINSPLVRFEPGNAAALPVDDAAADVVVSGLVLNFVPDYEAMAREMVRVTRPGGRVAAYVWDYAGAMEIMRHFWDAAVAISPHDAQLDQGERFPICQPEPLQALFEDVGLQAVLVRAIDIPAVFQNFEDYWTPFLGKIGSAPTYLATVDEATRERIRQLLQARLVPQADGTIALRARAWAVQGTV